VPESTSLRLTPSCRCARAGAASESDAGRRVNNDQPMTYQDWPAAKTQLSPHHASRSYLCLKAKPTACGRGPFNQSIHRS
jgi:hypothetical protein